MTDPLSFASASARFDLPYLFAGQAQKEFTVNEAIARIDALLHGAIEGEASSPPATPAEGDCWLVGPSPSGAWADQAGHIACHQAGSWLFVVPLDGTRIFNRTTGQIMLYSGGWQAPSVPAAPTGGATIDSQARTAIAGLVTVLRQAGILPE